MIAPDLPGFGFTEVPAERRYKYTFDSTGKNNLRVSPRRSKLYPLCHVRIRLRRPTGFRLALMAPERVTAIVSQNGNAYEEGLGDAWQPIQRYWREPRLSIGTRSARGLNLEGCGTNILRRNP